MECLHRKLADLSLECPGILLEFCVCVHGSPRIDAASMPLSRLSWTPPPPIVCNMGTICHTDFLSGSQAHAWVSLANPCSLGTLGPSPPSTKLTSQFWKNCLPCLPGSECHVYQVHRADGSLHVVSLNQFYMWSVTDRVSRVNIGECFATAADNHWCLVGRKVGRLSGQLAGLGSLLVQQMPHVSLSMTFELMQPCFAG